MKPLRVYALAATVGSFCVLFLMLGGRYAGIVPEWAGQLAWLVLVLSGSGLCGYLHPHNAWRWGAVVIGVQPLVVVAVSYVVGELEHPSSSMGGMVAVAIFSTLALLISPLPILASSLGGAVRKRLCAKCSWTSSSAQ